MSKFFVSIAYFILAFSYLSEGIVGLRTKKVEATIILQEGTICKTTDSSVQKKEKEADMKTIITSDIKTMHAAKNLPPEITL